MLHEFLTANREELIERCRMKTAIRHDSSTLPPASPNGAPLFLAQVVETLLAEAANPEPDSATSKASREPTEIGRAAALNGAELLRRGYTVDHVVHDYGDICQSITELAIERSAEITTDEFRILNRSLDNAIADAVSAYGAGRVNSVAAEADTIGGHLDYFSSAQQALIDTAIQSFTALQTGRLGLGGSTAMAHLQSLRALRALTEQTISAVRLASARSTLPPPLKH